MLVKNIYIRIGTNIITAAIGFIPIILIIRIFGAETWGRIIYYYSMAGVFSIFTDLGLTTAYNKFLASDDNPRDIAVFLFLKLLLIAGYVVIFVSAYFLKFRNGQMDEKLLWVVFVVLLLELISQFFTASFIGKRDFAYMSVSEIFASILLFVYTLFVCFIVPNIYVLASTKMVLPLVMIIRGYAYFRKKKIVCFLLPVRAEIMKYISFAAPIAFSSISGTFISYADKLVLGRLMGEKEIGFYQIAQRCYAVVDKFIKPVTNTMFTEIVHRIANVPDFFHKRFQDLMQILGFFSGVLTIILIFSSTFVIITFFGVENARSAFILKFCSLSIVSRLFWRPYSNVILAIEKHRLVTLLDTFGVFIMIGCYYLLIPASICGVHIGAAALPITEFITWIVPTGFLKLIILKKHFGEVHILETILKIWLPLLFAVLIGYCFNYRLWLLPIELAIFIWAGFYMRILTKDRLMYLYSPFITACKQSREYLTI